ncbi:MAG: type II toxin-antitoxin system RelE/ParE family toxin [Spirosomaceae bacterium]|jgi:plasmid stabilization system protein ParE|nr:type II toxin-antitoxin system RelE/ParE family toxin [Spirosomataceae bacterium]
MALEIEFTHRAEHNLEVILAYLEVKWSAKVKTDFLAKLSEQLFLISEMPFLYPASSVKKDIRRCVVNKHTAVYYRIEAERILVITIQDTRMNPENLQL